MISMRNVMIHEYDVESPHNRLVLNPSFELDLVFGFWYLSF